MPSLPVRSCIEPNCPNAAPFRSSRCAEHGGARGGASARTRGYDRQWELLRREYLSRHPMCRACRRKATVVDHVSPRRIESAAGRDPDREANLQPLCATCHGRKTVEETR